MTNPSTYLLAAVVLTSQTLFGQVGSATGGLAANDTLPIGKIIYKQQTTLSGDSDKNGNAVLLFNRYHSTYILTDIPSETRTEPDENTVLRQVRGDKEGLPVYKMHKEQQILYRTKCLGEKGYCVVKDTFKNIDWALQPEHKRFGQYDCRRATGKFRGRDYEAWYTLDIPIPSGPHKLGGLPGMIMEAHTSDRTVEFLFVSIEMSNDIKTPIKKPNGKSTGKSHEAYMQAELDRGKAMEKEFRAKGHDVSINPNPDVIEKWEEQK